MLFDLVGKGVAIPLPPRCRNRVDSLYLPACGFPAPGDSKKLALETGNTPVILYLDRQSSLHDNNPIL